jgi:hypothetical protein
MTPLIRLAHTLTKLSECEGSVVVTGSHGGLYCGRLAIEERLRAVIFNDAGVGLDGAGIAALDLLAERGIAAAAASHRSCRIGDAEDMMDRGIISYANSFAVACKVVAGLDCATAAEWLIGAGLRDADPPDATESRLSERPPGACRSLVFVDSASLVDAEADRGAVIVTGSHGALVGGDPKMALRVDGYAAAFNDAGIGIDRAGLGRLRVLDERGIAAITVAAMSARIGEARSTFEGRISAANDTARRLGAREGMRAKDVLSAWARSA